MQPQIVAETDTLLVVNKPAGLIVHSDGRTVEDSLADWVLARYPELKMVGDDWVSPQGEHICTAGILHRLDRSTSGILLVAKSRAAWVHYKNEFKERRIKKTYRALVHGTVTEDTGTICAEIMRSSTVPKHWYARPCELSDKRAAITEWKKIDQLTDATYIEARPVTGRTHQIRVHFSSIGHPLVGDMLYGADTSVTLGFKRPALHAYSIAVFEREKALEFNAPLPPDFLEALATKNI